MSARDVLADAMNMPRHWPDDVRFKRPDAYLAALSAAGYAVVPVELLQELADDLAAHIAAHYGSSTGYPSMDRKRAADMEVVNRARAMLAANQENADDAR